MIELDTFLYLVDQKRFGTIPGMGSGSYTGVECPQCGKRSNHTKVIYTKGFKCWECGFLDEGWAWMPRKPETGGYDGPYLMPAGDFEPTIMGGN
jgi:hypothetical protein